MFSPQMERVVYIYLRSNTVQNRQVSALMEELSKEPKSTVKNDLWAYDLWAYNLQAYNHNTSNPMSKSGQMQDIKVLLLTAYTDNRLDSVDSVSPSPHHHHKRDGRGVMEIPPPLSQRQNWALERGNADTPSQRWNWALERGNSDTPQTVAKLSYGKG